MTTLETILIWGTIYLYTAASVLLLTAFIFNKDKLLRWTNYFLLPAFAAHTVEFGLRWMRTGYFPANGDFEETMGGLAEIFDVVGLMTGQPVEQARNIVGGITDVLDGDTEMGLKRIWGLSEKVAAESSDR